MEKLCFGLDDDSGTGDQKQTNPQESRLLSIQRCIKHLVHASQCRDVNCRLPGCQKMKRVVRHAKSCKQKTNGGCPICKNFIALCCCHEKHCQEAKCPVPFCVNIKNKLRQQQLQQRLQQAQILERHIATMQNRGMSSAVLQPSPGNSNSSSQPSSGAQPHTSPHPPQPSIDMNPSSGPPVGALQALQQVQASAARQAMPRMFASYYGNENPVVNPAAANTGLMTPNQQMQAQMQNPMSQMSGWENSGYLQNQQPHQNSQHVLNPQLSLHQPSQIIGGLNSMPNSIGDSAMEPSHVMSNPGPSIAGMQRPTPAWQQLLQTLKSPASAQQQQQVLAILKANPQLMAAFIKQRTAQQRQQQQQFQQQLLQEEQQQLQQQQQEQQHHQQQQQQFLQQQQQLFQQLYSSPYPPQPDIGIRFSFRSPPDAVQTVQREQAAAARQTLPMLDTNYGKSPSSAQQQYQILAIMKDNPQLMADIIKQHSNFSSIENVD